MPNQNYEQRLVDDFVQQIRRIIKKDCNDPIVIYNDRCGSRTFADIEFTLPSGQRWAIEAKSDESSDRHNTVHKLFGELLKEAGCNERENCNIGVLIPESEIDFYRNSFRKIRKCKFICFGILIPVHYVFSYGESGVRHTSLESVLRSWILGMFSAFSRIFVNTA